MLGASKYIVLDLSEVFSGKKLLPRQSLKHMNRNCTFYFFNLAVPGDLHHRYQTVSMISVKPGAVVRIAVGSSQNLITLYGTVFHLVLTVAFTCFFVFSPF